VFPISLDINFWQNLHYNNIFILSLELLLAGGWVFVLWQFWKPIKDFWINWRQEIFAEQNPNVLLEIRPPKNSERKIEAIEQFLDHIHALRRSMTWWETWWKGQFILKISLEIVSFEGQIRFFIRSTYKHKNAIEHALQSQYPGVEIKELSPEEDFVNIFPDKMPDPEFEMLGSEYVLAKPQFYPIKTYKEYEYLPAQEFLDPLRHLWELMSHLKEGEYLWYQINLVPEDEEWALDKKTEVDKLLGKDVKERPPEVDKSIIKLVSEQFISICREIIKVPFSIIREFYRQLFVGTGSIISSQLKDDTYSEIKSQLSGIPSEAGRQIYCLHDAFLGQFRKKKPKKEPEPEPETVPLILENQVQVQPNVQVNVEATKLPDYLFRSDKQKRVIDAIERKLSKQVFKACIRVVYFAKKPVFSKFRFWVETHGFFRHFSDVDYNVWSRGKYSKTTADYFFAKKRKRLRQNSLLFNAKGRDWYAGDDWNYLTTEEIASLWHLPHQKDLLANFVCADSTVKAPPFLERTNAGFKDKRLLDYQKGEVPSNLPITDFEPYCYS